MIFKTNLVIFPEMKKKKCQNQMYKKFKTGTYIINKLDVSEKILNSLHNYSYFSLH